MSVQYGKLSRAELFAGVREPREEEERALLARAREKREGRIRRGDDAFLEAELGIEREDEVWEKAKDWVDGEGEWVE